MSILTIVSSILCIPWSSPCSTGRAGPELSASMRAWAGLGTVVAEVVSASRNPQCHREVVRPQSPHTPHTHNNPHTIISTFSDKILWFSQPLNQYVWWTGPRTKQEVIPDLKMLHSAAPSSFNMFPFSHPPQHPGPAPPSHHADMFHPPHTSHHHHNHQQQQTEVVSRPKFLFKMPRVVPNQKEKFETDEFMKRHSREGEVSNANQGRQPSYRNIKERKERSLVVCPRNALRGTRGFYNELHNCSNVD